MTVIRIGHVLTLAAAALLATGCSSLERELEQERDPARTATPTPPEPTPTPTTEPSTPTTAPLDPAGKPCPESGVRIVPGRVDGAMGLRAMSVTLTNCGTNTYELNGYPAVRVLDEDRDPYDIEVFEGTEAIAMAPDDPGPRPLTLKPGESARSGLAWRMMSTDATATYLEIAPVTGQRSQTVETIDGPLDLVDTGRLGTTAWQKSD